MRNSNNINNMRKEYKQIRKIDYQVRDLSHLDQGNEIVRSGGCLLKFLLFAIIIAGVSAGVFMFKKNIPLSDTKHIYKFDNGTESKLLSYDKRTAKSASDKNYYKVSIALESETKGRVSLQSLINIKYLQKIIKKELKIDSRSMADYVEKTFVITKKTQNYSAMKGSNDIIVLRIFSLLEGAGFNFEDFTGLNYSHYYLYLKYDNKNSLQTLKPKILEIVKRYSKERKTKLFVDLSKGPGSIIPFSKIKDNAGTLVIEK